jgi:hypothetical protein
MSDEPRFADVVKIEILVPCGYVVPLREALHLVGAGRVGNYDHCLSVAQVTGFWRPLAGAQPYDGVAGAISEGAECKMELRCPRALIAEAVRAIRRIHPYEEPVINVIPLLAVD